MSIRSRKFLLPLLLAATTSLGGCYYAPYPAYAYGYGYPGYGYPAPYPGYYGPSPFVGAVVVGGGYRGRGFYR